MVSSMRALPLALLLFVVPLAAVVPSTAVRVSFPCAVAPMAGIGLVCEQADGMLAIYGPDGTFYGTTHGPDPPEDPAASVVGSTPNSGTTWWPERQPYCVDKATESHYAEVIYAVAFDDTDRYDALLPTIRQMTRQSNGIVDYTAMLDNVHADLRVVCEGGDIAVRHEVLPTSKASASYWNIQQDLRARGYSNVNAKYLVLYDNPIDCGCSGLAVMYRDDRLVAENQNNGGFAQYAMTFCTCTNTWLHELGHTLGAVQNAAPRSTGGAHCTDGFDVMCYADSGPYGSQYTSGVCAVRVFDCNQDTYFDAAPEAGEWLETHWNVGSRLVRFIEFDGSVLRVSCTARVVSGTPATCSLRGGNPDAAGVRYHVAWGDGTTETFPASGFLPTDTLVNATHAFAGDGIWTVTAWAEDDGSPARESARVPTVVEARAEWAPDLAAFSCTARVAPNVAATCTASVGDVDGDALRLVVAWGDGATTTTAATGPTVTASHAYAAEGTYAVQARAEQVADGVASAPRTASVVVTNGEPPVLDPVTCTKTASSPLTLQCRVKATEPDGQRVRYVVQWGDGTTSTTGYTTAGVQVAMSHAYANTLSRTIQAKAEDESVPPKVSAWRTFVHDERAPTLTLYDPEPYSVYQGCGWKQHVPVESITVNVGNITVEDPGIDVDLSWMPVPGAVMVQKGCIRFRVTDDHAGVDAVSLYIPGACEDQRHLYIPTPPTTTVEVEYDVCRAGWGQVWVDAWDRNGNWVSRQAWVEDVYSLNELLTSSISFCHPPGAGDYVHLPPLVTTYPSGPSYPEIDLCELLRRLLTVQQ